jgi:plastocyanin
MAMMARKASVSLLLAVVSGCGGGGTPSGPSPPASNPNVITITSGGGATPKELTVSPGARVLFVNNDSRRHDMSSDEHPDHLECPALNQVGLLNPGQSRESGNLVVARTCGFHDHDDPSNNSLKGRIVIR